MRVCVSIRYHHTAFQRARKTCLQQHVRGPVFPHPWGFDIVRLVMFASGMCLKGNPLISSSKAPVLPETPPTACTPVTHKGDGLGWPPVPWPLSAESAPSFLLGPLSIPPPPPIGSLSSSQWPIPVTSKCLSCSTLRIRSHLIHLIDDQQATQLKLNLCSVQLGFFLKSDPSPFFPQWKALSSI